MNCLRSVFRRFRHALAWDRWRVRRELPAGFRLRRYVALNGAGAVVAMCGLCVAIAEIVVVRWRPPCSGVVVPVGLTSLFWTFLHFASRSRIHRVPLPRRTRSGCLWRTLYWTAVVAVALATAGKDFVPAVFVFAALYVFRAAFAPKKTSGAETYVVTDTGRVFAGVVRPVALLWALYVVSIPLRPLDVRHPPRELVAEWLYDENGCLRKPLFFELESLAESPDTEEGISNLLSRVGDPPPERIRLVVGMSKLQSPKTGVAMDDLSTNVVDAAFAALHFGSDVSAKIAAVRDLVSAAESRRDVQTEAFAILDGSVNSKAQKFSLMPQYAGVLNSLQWNLAAAADSGNVEMFSDAMRLVEGVRDAMSGLRGGLLATLVSMLCERIQVSHVIRFSERTDVPGSAFAAEAARIAGRPVPEHARRMVQAIADDLAWDHLLFTKRDWEECGCWVLFGMPDPEEFANGASFGPIRRAFGGAMMTAFGTDFRSYRALEEELVEWNVADAAARLDPSFESAVRPGGMSPCRKLLRRGGYYRVKTEDAFNALEPFVAFEARARYADAMGAVQQAVLLLARFRREYGCDPVDLEGASAALGVDMPDPKSDFVELQYWKLPPESGKCPDGGSAYAIALVCKPHAPAWFRSARRGRDRAWLVIRNPAFPGTRPYRIYEYDASVRGKAVIPPTLAGFLPSVSDIRFLSVSGPEGVAEAERRLKDAGWSL